MNNIIIGLTGRFGAGCTTTYNLILTEYKNFIGFSLSGFLKELAENNDDYKNASDKHKRIFLQDLGDNLRIKHGEFYIADEIIKRVENLKEKNINIVVESFKNPSEINLFRKKFSNFYLFAIDAETESRWERTKSKYDLDRKTFNLDDERDKGNDEEPYSGQQVKACMRLADILVNSEKSFYNLDGKANRKVVEEYGQKIKGYIDLIQDNGNRTPRKDELFMHQACSISLNSRCLKRQVGAVIVLDSGKEDYNSYILATGYNNVPDGEEACIECYRDREIIDIIKKNKYCLNCGQKIINPETFKCPSCNENFYKPKLLDLCRAVHAEENAILQAAKLGIGINETTLYTSTHPCLLCSKMIINSGIKNIVYLESYPMLQSVEMLDYCGINRRKFEGVNSRSFNRLFTKNY